MTTTFPMELEIIRVSATVGFLTAASYYDLFNKKNVPVAIPYAMIAAGFLLNLLTLSQGAIISSSAITLAVFGIGYLIYRIGQIGGADVLVFAGIALLLPEIPASILPQLAIPLFTYPFVVSVFLVSGFLAIIGLSAKYIPAVISALLKGKIKIRAQSALASILIVGSYLVVVYVFASAGILSPTQSALLLFLVLLAGFLTTFKEFISSTMVQWVPLKQIDDEDVIALHYLDPKLVAKLKLQPVLVHSELEKLRTSKLKKFPIFKGMPPFLPYVLLSVLLLLIFGDPFKLLFI